MDNLKILNAVTDFPLPDSPTIPRTLFFFSLKLIFLTIDSLSVETFKFFISSTVLFTN